MPYLKLKIISGSEIGQNDNYSFTELGGSIGRSEDCEWTLIDSDRFVSKKHLVISYRNQQFVLTDVSSNGVIVNSADESLGRGNEHILRVVDTLIVGKQVLKVEDINTDMEDVNPFQAQYDDGDLLGLIMGASAAPTLMQEPQDLLKIPDVSDLFSDLKPKSDQGLEDILSAPIQSHAANERSNFNEQFNPFNVSTPFAAPVNVSPASDTKNSSSHPNDALIPDDWEMFDINSTPSDFSLPTETDISVEPAVSIENFEKNQNDNNFSLSDILQNVPEVTPEKHSPIFNEESLQDIGTTPQQLKPAPPLTKLIPPKDVEKTLQGVSTPENSTSTNDDFFTSLYDKLGLSKEFRATINQATFADDVATILLSTTQGLMSLLASRSAFKQESRLSSTLIQPRSNNPIKFSIDPVDTLEMLLVKKKKGYMSVGDSYDEAVEDIQLHQMAFMSGLQGTLDGVLAQLNPEDIEKQVSKKSQRFMPLNSNSQCWQVYKEKQPLLAKSVKENINEVLGTYFSEAYQSQINSFKNEK
jgi:type VI secretion system protein